MKKNYKSVLLLVSLLILFTTYLTHSEIIVKEIKNYSWIFFQNIFPSSFIFLLLSYLLMENNLFYYMNRIIKNKGLYFFLLALISGYPTGTIYIKDALIKNEITKQEANNYLLFSHFPNPLFVIYHCKILFPHTNVFLFFYGIIILSQLIIFLIVPKARSREKTSILKNNSFTSTFQNSLSKTTSTLLIIYGTSVFFYLLSCVIFKHFVFSSNLYVGISGIFDLTNGILTCKIIKNNLIKGLFLYFFIVFGSFPIHLQIKSILSDTSIPYLSFFKGRIISYLLCCFLWIIYYTRTILIG